MSALGDRGGGEGLPEAVKISRGRTPSSTEKTEGLSGVARTRLEFLRGSSGWGAHKPSAGTAVL